MYNICYQSKEMKMLNISFHWAKIEPETDGLTVTQHPFKEENNKIPQIHTWNWKMSIINNKWRRMYCTSEIALQNTCSQHLNLCWITVTTTTILVFYYIYDSRYRRNHSSQDPVHFVCIVRPTTDHGCDTAN